MRSPHCCCLSGAHGEATGLGGSHEFNRDKDDPIHRQKKAGKSPDRNDQIRKVECSDAKDLLKRYRDRLPCRIQQGQKTGSIPPQASGMILTPVE